MSYSRFLSKLGRFFTIVLESFVCLIFIAMIVFSVWIDFYTESFIAGAILAPILIATFSFPLNWFLGKLYNAKFENTGYVYEGRSVIDIVRDESYYKRAFYVNVTLMGFFILAVFYFVYVATQAFTWGMIGLVMSVLGGVFYFLFAMSAREKSGMKNKREKEKFVEEMGNKKPIKKEVKKPKFNFNDYQEMLNVYNEYKQFKHLAIQMKYDQVKTEKYKQVCLKRDENFEKLSKMVYETFNSEQPGLINKKTGEKIKWEEMFGVDFEKFTLKQKDTLIRLLDASPYKFEKESYYNKNKN